MFRIYRGERIRIEEEPTPRLIHHMLTSEEELPRIVEDYTGELAAMYRANGWRFIGSTMIRQCEATTREAVMGSLAKATIAALSEGAILGPISYELSSAVGLPMDRYVGVSVYAQEGAGL